jgi:hypothetical protein
MYVLDAFKFSLLQLGKYSKIGNEKRKIKQPPRWGCVEIEIGELESSEKNEGDCWYWSPAAG